MAESIFTSTLPQGLRRGIQWSLKGRTPIFAGESGIGKSDGIRTIWADGIQEAKGFSEFHCLLDWRVSAVDALSTRGVPSVTDEGRTHLNPPDELPNSGPGYCLFDEFGQFPSASVAHAFYQLFREGRLGDWIVPEDVFLVCATNRRQDGAHLKKFDRPLRQRLAWIDIGPNVQVWQEWACENDVFEPVICATSLFPELVAGGYDGSVDYTQPTGRELVALSDVLKGGVPEGDILGYCHDVCGPEGAVKLAPFCKQYEGLISVPDVISDPENTAIPDADQFDNTIALVVALSRYARAEDTPAVLTYVDRLNNEWRALFAKTFPLLNGAANARGEGQGLRGEGYDEWIIKNKSLTS
jgi:hypothetical protein